MKSAAKNVLAGKLPIVTQISATTKARCMHASCLQLGNQPLAVKKADAADEQAVFPSYVPGASRRASYFPDAKPFSFFVTSPQMMPSPVQPVLDRRPTYTGAAAAQSVVLPDRAPLKDMFGRFHDYLRISLTEKCNLRCQYCMPAEGVDLSPRDMTLSPDEIIKLAEVFISQGVSKIRLTGGEPLVNKNIVDIISRLRSNPKLQDIAITTNGLVLARKLPALKAAGLTQINISLDTLQPLRFEQISRRKGHDRVLDAIDAAVMHGYVPCKINCVMMRNVNDDELLDFIEFTRTKPVDVRFIEYMPFDGNKWQQAKMVPYAEMLASIHAHYGPERVQRIADKPNDTSKAYRIDGYAGQFGFISSMTDHFCGSCNRIRLTADGNLKVCLFGSSEISLRDAMRSGASDEELVELIGEAVGRKKKQHAGMLNIAANKNRPMILIGG